MYSSKFLETFGQAVCRYAMVGRFNKTEEKSSSRFSVSVGSNNDLTVHYRGKSLRQGLSWPNHPISPGASKLRRIVYMNDPKSYNKGI